MQFLLLGSTLSVLLSLYAVCLQSSLVCHPLAFALLLGTLGLLLLVVCRFPARSMLICLTVTYTLYVLGGFAVGASKPSFGFEPYRLTHMEGVLIEDSLLTRSNKQVIRLTLQSAATQEGHTAEASGVVSALLKTEELLVSGTAIEMDGRLSETGDLFLCTSFQVISLTSLGLKRRSSLSHLNIVLQKRIADTSARSLAQMLLLGQSSEASFILKDASLGAGCAHLLALSGMHLQLFLLLSSSFCSLLFGPYWGKRFGFLLPFAYVVLVGPKPSLVRALLMHLFSLFPVSQELRPVFSLLLAYAVQLWLFWYAVTSFAFLFSYAAITMLILGRALPSFPLKTTALAILGTAPASMILTGSWNLAGLLFSYPAGLLIHLLMLLSLFSLIIGGYPVILLTQCTAFLEDLLALATDLPLVFSSQAYLLYLLVLLTCIALIGYAGQALHKRRRYRNELDLCLRFTERNHSPFGAGGSGDEQEVWTELPDIPPSA